MEEIEQKVNGREPGILVGDSDHPILDLSLTKCDYGTGGYCLNDENCPKDSRSCDNYFDIRRLIQI